MGKPENYADPAKFSTLEKEDSANKKQRDDLLSQLELIVEKVLILEEELG
jgi:hypothetical protein